MQYALVTELPVTVQRALTALEYHRKDIGVQASESVTLSRGGMDGYRGFVCLVNLTSGEFATTWGSWGGTNMFNPANAVDNDDRPVTLPADGLAITGYKGGGKPVSATIHVPATMVNRMLPGPPVDMTEAEKIALCIFKGYKSSYRAERLQHFRIDVSVLNGLVERGFLSQNKAGARTITTAGKNAIADFRPPHYI